MRVLIVAGHAGNVLNFRLPLLKLLESLGHEVKVVAPALTDNIVEQLRQANIASEQFGLERTGLNPLADIRSISNLIKVMQNFRPDYVLTFTAKPSVYGVIAAKWCGISTITSVIEGLGFAFLEGREPRRMVAKTILKHMYRFTLPRAQHVVFLNSDDRNLFYKMSILKDQSQSSVVPGIGLDLKKFAPVPIPDQTCFLLIARFLKDKGVEEYAKACQILKDKGLFFRCIIVGYRDDSPNSVSENTVAEWAVQGLENLGKLDDVRPAIAQASVMVLPSYREGFPRVIMEGMAMARAVIATDVPGCRQTVEVGRNGFLVPARDVQALAEAMMRFIEKPQLATTMGQESLVIARQNFDEKDLAKQLIQRAGIPFAA
jgi:glycosyltransferase involved in cell wall biosynthesis